MPRKSEDEKIRELLLGGKAVDKQVCRICQRPTSRKKDEPICNCLQEKMLRNMLAEAGVPRGYIQYTMADWNPKQTVAGDDLSVDEAKKKEWVGKFMARYIAAIPAIAAGLKLRGLRDGKPIPVHSLLLGGGRQTGRSFLAAVAVIETIRCHHSAHYYEWNDLVQILSDYTQREEHELIAEHFRNTLFIAIDNVAKQDSWAPSFKRQIERVCRLRGAAKLPVILTASTNTKAEWDGIRDMDLGDGWASLQESCFFIDLPGKKK